MTTPSDVLRVAASQLGVSESPDGSDQTPYSQWYGLIGAWCAMFQSWCFFHAGMPLAVSSPKGFAWCSAGSEWFKAQNRLTMGTAGIRAGDLIFFEWGRTQGGYDHIGIVEAVNGNGTVTTIEGNVRNKVQRLYRSLSADGIDSYARPAYSGTSTHRPPITDGRPTPTGARPVLRLNDRGPAVKELQRLLNQAAQIGLSVDGVFGNATRQGVLNFQGWNGLTKDGIVGPQTWAAIDRALRI